MDILSGKGKNPSRNLSPRDLADIWQKKQAEKDDTPDDSGKIKRTAESEAVPEVSESSKPPELRRGSSHSIIELGHVRKHASILKQIWLSHNRSIVQQFRRFASFVLEIGVACLAGGLMGLAIMVPF
jgi:hypothetical protein